MAFKQKKRQKKLKNKYLKPGALAQIRNRRTTNRSCTDIGKKRVVLESQTGEVDRIVACTSNHVPNPVGVSFWPTLDLAKQYKQPGTPKTPQVVDCNSHSSLESLPLDLLIKILCHLHHDQLRAVFHVSQRLRTAVLLARQLHFNYTTPNRYSKEDWKDILNSPRTPKAPKHLPRRLRIPTMDMKQIAAVLFQESTLPPRKMTPLRLPWPVCKPEASARGLFYEDELCQAVAKNKLR